MSPTRLQIRTIIICLTVPRVFKAQADICTNGCAQARGSRLFGRPHSPGVTVAPLRVRQASEAMPKGDTLYGPNERQAGRSETARGAPPRPERSRTPVRKA